MGTAETVGASRRSAVFAPVSRCVALQAGASVTGRWTAEEAKHRAFSAMASFAFVVRFSASGRNRTTNAACGLSPHPFLNAKSATSVSAFGENSSCFLAFRLQTKPAALGFRLGDFEIQERRVR